MTNLHFFIAAYIFSGVIVSFYNGLFSFISINKGKQRFFETAIFFVCALMFLEHVLTHFDIVPFDFHSFPFSTRLLLTFKYCDFLVGPLLYFILMSLFKKKYQKILLHFLPAVFIQFLLHIVIILKQNKIVSIDFLEKFFDILEFCGLSHLMLYLAVIIYQLVSLYSYLKRRYRNGLRLISIIILLLVSNTMMDSYILGIGNLDESIAVLIAVTVVFLFVGLLTYFSEFFIGFQKEFQRGLYKRSLIKGIDKDLINTRLEQLMQDEKLYADEDLTLQKLASYMELSTHQLSEFLNARLKQSFITYINRKRVDDVKQQLIEHPARSVIDIAFSAGFNSKSSFNKVFKEYTGISPSQFRDQKRHQFFSDKS